MDVTVRFVNGVQGTVETTVKDFERIQMPQFV